MRLELGERAGHTHVNQQLLRQKTSHSQPLRNPQISDAKTKNHTHTKKTPTNKTVPPTCLSDPNKGLNNNKNLNRYNAAGATEGNALKKTGRGQEFVQGGPAKHGVPECGLAHVGTHVASTIPPPTSLHGRHSPLPPHTLSHIRRHE